MADLMTRLRRALGLPDGPRPPVPPEERERLLVNHRLAVQERRLRAIDERIAQDRGGR